MKLLLDVHTHTVASGHAYSHLEDNIRVAKEKGLLYYGVSDHAPSMPGSTHIFYFQNLKVLPRKMHGIHVLRGAEANILDYDGSIDLVPATMAHLDYIIASAHVPCLPFGSKEENTNALINAMKHPKVSIIGHPDDGRYPIDHEALVKAAKEKGVILEANNASLNPKGFRHNTKENLEKILKLCIKYQVYVLASSDAHISTDVGNVNYVEELFAELNFPEQLIINSRPEKFLEIINFTE